MILNFNLKVLLTDRAVDLIESHNSDTPMFMYFSSSAVHTPVEVDQEYVDLYPDMYAVDPHRAKFMGKTILKLILSINPYLVICHPISCSGFEIPQVQ